MSSSTALDRPERLALFRWLVAFTQIALRDAAPAVLAALPDRLVAVAQIAGSVLPANLIPARLRPRRRAGASHGVFLTSDGYLMGRWAAQDTHRLHRQLATILDALLPPTAASPALERGMAFIPARLGRVYLFRDGGRIRRRYGAADANLIWFGIADLLEEFGGLLTLCAAPGCGTIFVRERRQRYCSASCSQQVRSATWYRTHRRRALRARRRRYEAEMKVRAPGARPRPYRPRHRR